MTAIVERYVGVTAIVEGAASALSMTFGQMEQWLTVRLTEDALALVGAPVLRRGRDFAVQLDALYFGEDGMEDGVDLAERDGEGAQTGTVRVDLELRSADGGLITIRSTELPLTSGLGALAQIVVDPDQGTRIADPDADPPVVAGNRGRLIMRWAAGDLQPPPEGLWDWRLYATRASGVIEDLCAGKLEVVR